MKTSYTIILYVSIIFIVFSLLWQYPEFRFAITGKVYNVTQPTTANVTVSGIVGDINVTPPLLVNFTAGISGLIPGMDYTPKTNTYPYLIVKLNATSNSPFNLYINATNLTGTTGQNLPVFNISVNTTCNGTAAATLFRLSHSLQALCEANPVPRYNSTKVYFYLDIPLGQYNDTYTGSIWFYANYTGAGNSTWYGPNNTTAKVRKWIEIQWNSTSTPIIFGTMAPGSSSNASESPPYGFPTSLISGAATNVFIDWYLNGTDLACVSGGCTGYEILSFNVTYSNATAEPNWPDGIKALNTSWPVSSINGDFPNWGNVGNNSDTLVWFNISIEQLQPAGDYEGNLTAKAVGVGEDPT